METLNLDLLPDEAKKELIEHYNLLKSKYFEKGELQPDKISNISQEIDKLSWRTEEKLFKSREDLYEE